MPTVVRLSEERYSPAGLNLGELFDQIPAPIAYFDSSNSLGACNLSFRNAFPVVIESEFLTRAGAATVLKFTPEGGQVSIEVFRRGKTVAIAVSDSGIGIRTEDIPAVLEPFGQVENELGRKHKGTGLGLPLTKELAELHGGALTIEGNMGFGTIVTILIPAT